MSAAPIQPTPWRLASRVALGVRGDQEEGLSLSDAPAIYEERQADAYARIRQCRAAIASLPETFADSVEAIADALALPRWPNRITNDEARSIRLDDIESTVKRLREVLGAFLGDGAP
jgi:hypothetical protein